MEANPPPNVNWQKDGTDVTLDADERMSQLENGSLNIASSQLSDSGTWTVIAENGLGQVERKQIELNVHPSSLPITVRTRWLKIIEIVSFNNASEASYDYIWSGQKFNKKWLIWRVFENLKLVVKQCYQIGQF